VHVLAPSELAGLTPKGLATNMPRKIDKNKRNYTSGFSELRKPWTSPIIFVSKFLIVGGSFFVFGRVVNMETVSKMQPQLSSKGCR
jgi:hypothetical protein